MKSVNLDDVQKTDTFYGNVSMEFSKSPVLLVKGLKWNVQMILIAIGPKSVRLEFAMKLKKHQQSLRWK